jgi:hypothetical protein
LTIRIYHDNANRPIAAVYVDGSLRTTQQPASAVLTLVLGTITLGS